MKQEFPSRSFRTDGMHDWYYQTIVPHWYGQNTRWRMINRFQVRNWRLYGGNLRTEKMKEWMSHA